MKVVIFDPSLTKRVAKIVEAEGWKMGEEPLEWKLLDRINKTDEQVRELTRQFVGLKERLNERGII
jgi:hypothetical protein